MLKSLTTANYDEAFGFNYRSIAGILLPRMTTNEIFWSIWVIANVEKT